MSSVYKLHEKQFSLSTTGININKAINTDGYNLAIGENNILPSFEHDWEETIKEINQAPSIIEGLLKRIDLLGHLYTLKNNPNQIKSFIYTYSNIINPLFEAQLQIRHIFESITETYLDLIFDPEEDSEKLFIVIVTNMTPEKSIEHLNRLRQKWWFKVEVQIRKIVGIDIEII